MKAAPPFHVSPADLFRILTSVPRPRVWLGRDMYVEPLTPSERNECESKAAAIAGGTAGEASWLYLEIAAKALHRADGSRPLTAETLASMVDDGPLWTDAIWNALLTVEPASADSQAWLACLGDGCKANSGRAYALAGCVEGSDWFNGPPRPDRFFGVPLGDVCPAQWLAYRAARNVIVEPNRRG